MSDWRALERRCYFSKVFPTDEKLISVAGESMISTMFTSAKLTKLERCEKTYGQ